MRGMRRRLLISGVEIVECICSDGRQCILTDWIPLADTKLELKARRTNVRLETGLNNVFWASANTDGLHEFSMNNGGVASEANAFIFWNYMSYNNNNQYVRRTDFRNFDGEEITTIRMSSTEGSLENSIRTIKMALMSRDVDGDTSLYLFANKKGESYNRGDLYIYGVRCWNNGILERDFVPAKKNGIYGLYDKVNKKFWRSSTGVDFLGKDK